MTAAAPTAGGFAAPDRSALPAGPRIPHFAQSAGWLFFPIPFITACRRRFGKSFTIQLAGFPPLVVVSDPAHVKEVFTKDPDVAYAGQANAILKPILGASSLLLLDGQRHRDERKLMMPALHGERMHAYGQVMRERADRAIDEWPLGRPFPLHREMQEITLDVILRTVFGVDDTRHGGLRAALVQMLKLGEHPSLMLLIGRNGELRGKGLHERLGRFSPWAGVQRALEGVDAQLLAEVRRRRAGDAREHDDVLSMLLSARDETGRGLGDQDLVDEMKTLLVAGHETTATALTWTVLELIRNPAVLARLRREIETGDEYLDAVVRESLRLHPIVPMVGRQLQAPESVGGRVYPAGTYIAPNIYLTQHDPDVWPDPERFDPERFTGGKTNPYEFFPFGGGVRRCIGMAFALFEMRAVLRRIVRRARLALAPGYTPRMVRRGITFAVSKGLPVVLGHREPRGT